MSNSNSSSSSGGVGFCGLLTIVFITLKLIGEISWSWWWVLSPLWMPLGLVIVIGAFYFIYWWIKRVKQEKKFRKFFGKPTKPDRIEMPIQSKWEQRIEEMRKNKR